MRPRCTWRRARSSARSTDGCTSRRRRSLSNREWAERIARIRERGTVELEYRERDVRGVAPTKDDEVVEAETLGPVDIQRLQLVEMLGGIGDAPLDFRHGQCRPTSEAVSHDSNPSGIKVSFRVPRCAIKQMF